jgi:mannose-1-phosphate guanylyltransferase
MQLPQDVNIIIEPERRDTFPAIAFSITSLYSQGVLSANDVVAIMPVDPFVEPQFFDRIALIQNEIEKTDANIILLGNKPSEPTEKFGYIEIENSLEEAATQNDLRLDSQPDSQKGDLVSVPVAGFKEKPSLLEAQELIDRGALWNCGVFGLRVRYILDFLHEQYGVIRYEEEYIQNVFKTLPKISFDYEVVEQSKNIRAIEYVGSWKDLGTWESLTSEMSEFVLGDVLKDDSCVGTHILNELDIPIVALGVKDSVIVASSDGILVADKRETYRLKEVLADSEPRPMHEKKRWGEYHVLNRTDSIKGDTLTKKLTINEGKQISYQVHDHRKEIWTIVEGEGILYLDGKKQKVGCGDVATIEAGVKHGLHALTDLSVIEVQFGKPLIEEDIIRVQLEWSPTLS